VAEREDDVRRGFEEAVNMAPAELEKWLGTEESMSVGEADGGGESKGHESGRRIVEILRTEKGDLSAADFEHMRRVVAYVHRHAAQRPDGDISETPWRYSLMNWGHDPLN
jgi:SpoVK/Ycf46/Vps4 family AAA+-type ATPase